MTSKMHLATRKVCLALLAAGATQVASAAIATAPLEELEEVWVYGESLVQRIEAAEDRFFALYNSINTVKRYDVVCGMTSLDRDSMIMVRKCVPEFRVNYQPVSYYVPTSAFRSSSCTFPGDARWNSHFDSCFQVGREVLVTQGSRESQSEYAAHVVNLIQDEPRLREEAAELATLYDELDATRKRYVELKPPRRSGRSRAPRGM